MREKQFRYNESLLQIDPKQKLFLRQYTPNTMQAVVVILHGFTEHSGRYEKLSQYLANFGYVVHLYDQRGHGKTPGCQAYVKTFQELVQDLKLFLQWVKKQHPDLPLFLLGHSMGGQVSINYLAQEKENILRGAILSSPNVALAFKLPWIKKTLGPLAAKIFPYFRVNTEIDSTKLTHDPVAMKAYEEDLLIFKKTTLNFGNEIIKNLFNIMNLSKKIKVSVLVIHGSQDHVSEPSQIQNFYKNMASTDRQLIEYPNFYHECLQETGKEKVYKDIKNWILDRI